MKRSFKVGAAFLSLVSLGLPALADDGAGLPPPTAARAQLAPPFVRIWLDLENGTSMNVFAPCGMVTLTEAGRKLEGNVTGDELRELADAIAAADLASIPEPTPLPAYGQPAPRPLTIALQSDRNVRSHVVSGELLSREPYRTRVMKVVSALEKIEKRMLADADAPATPTPF
jgi:hypothetical protein